MRLLILSLFLLLTSISTQAQWLTRPRVQNNQNFDMKTISWGFYFGANNLDFNFDYERDEEDIQTERSVGFNVGLISDLRISEYINLRLEPGLVFNRRDLIFPANVQFDSEDDFIREVSSTYIYVPLLLRFSTKRVNNWKPFVTGGVAFVNNLSSNEDSQDDNFSGTFRSTRNNFFYEFGFGVDLYLFFFKFTPSIRGIFSFNDELIPDDNANSPWTGNISSLSTRGVFLNFTFQ